MWWRFVVVAALLAAAGCEPGAQDTAEVEAPPALVCTEGMFELMAFRGDVWESNVEGTRTELQQRAQGACQCLSAALTPADYDFVEDLASFQLWALRELQQFSTRQQEVGPRLIERAEGGPLQEGGGPQWAQLEQEMRQLAQRLVRDLGGRWQDDLAEWQRRVEQPGQGPSVIYQLRLANYLSRLDPPILSMDAYYDRYYAIESTIPGRCGVDFEQGFIGFWN